MRKKNTIKKIDKPDTAMKTFWRNNNPNGRANMLSD